MNDTNHMTSLEQLVDKLSDLMQFSKSWYMNYIKVWGNVERRWMSQVLILTLSVLLWADLWGMLVSLTACSHGVWVGGGVLVWKSPGFVHMCVCVCFNVCHGSVWEKGTVNDVMAHVFYVPFKVWKSKHITVLQSKKKGTLEGAI